ncbi:MAG: dethiobiotin synthase [Mycobacteriaceae bacterium]
MSVVVVTGTSTDVGKTITTAAIGAQALSQGVKVVVIKPVQTGVADDADGDLAQISRLTGIYETIELARYPDPLAPSTAARRCGRPMLSLDEVVHAVQSADGPEQLTLVEGAGGVLVPLGKDGFTILDLAAALSAPIVVVAAAGLGTLNHSALTVRAIVDRSISCLGVIIGSWPQLPGLAECCNQAELAEFTRVKNLGAIPAESGALSQVEFLRLAPRWLDLSGGIMPQNAV